MILVPESVTPEDLVAKVRDIFDDQDQAAMFELLLAYTNYRYPGGAGQAATKSAAKKDLDVICQIADEQLLRGNMMAAKIAVEKGYAKSIGPIRTFYRTAVMYKEEITPR